jgi:lipoprotein-anchoring transpeptidase ErfK/SrfK
VIDPANHYLYHVEGGGRATRYGVGVGREGFVWAGEATIKSKQEWPDWYPPKEMMGRRPDLKKSMVELQSGEGMQRRPRQPARRPRHVSLAREQGYIFSHPWH